MFSYEIDEYIESSLEIVTVFSYEIDEDEMRKREGMFEFSPPLGTSSVVGRGNK